MLAIVAQQLVPAADRGGRYPAVEIMMGTHAVRNLIRKGEDHQLYTAISTGRAEGMITMEQSLAEMARAGRITRETALAALFPARGSAAVFAGLGRSATRRRLTVVTSAA